MTCASVVRARSVQRFAPLRVSARLNCTTAKASVRSRPTLALLPVAQSRPQTHVVAELQLPRLRARRRDHVLDQRRRQQNQHAIHPLRPSSTRLYRWHSHHLGWNRRAPGRHPPRGQAFLHSHRPVQEPLRASRRPSDPVGGRRHAVESFHPARRHAGRSFALPKVVVAGRLHLEQPPALSPRPPYDGPSHGRSARCQPPNTQSGRRSPPGARGAPSP